MHKCYLYPLRPEGFIQLRCNSSWLKTCDYSYRLLKSRVIMNQFCLRAQSEDLHVEVERAVGRSP